MLCPGRPWYSSNWYTSYISFWIRSTDDHSCVIISGLTVAISALKYYLELQLVQNAVERAAIGMPWHAYVTLCDTINKIEDSSCCL